MSLHRSFSWLRSPNRSEATFVKKKERNPTPFRHSSTGTIFMLHREVTASQPQLCSEAKIGQQPFLQPPLREQRHSGLGTIGTQPTVSYSCFPFLYTYSWGQRYFHAFRKATVGSSLPPTHTRSDESEDQDATKGPIYLWASLSASQSRAQLGSKSKD